MKTSRIISALLVVASLRATCVLAQSAAPCPSDSARHQFDFWLGEWNVTTRDGHRVGSSRIESISGGCAILENWTSGRGGTGKSINAYDPTLKQWQQYWVGADGEISYFDTSEFDGKSMIFHSTTRATPSFLRRLTFTPQDANTVRQHSERSTDGGKSWQDEYDFYYHRRPAATP